ncbi:hypothetical protein P692DRAFT_20881809 [Suillus brevipes Sb2]|nr:hypothetical protein P692DRAFT_20881809 [Suillus brevipes Sb2]
MGIRLTLCRLGKRNRQPGAAATNFWIESPSDPTFHSAYSRPHAWNYASSKPLVLIQNAFLSPFYTSSLLQGADIVIHSLRSF